MNDERRTIYRACNLCEAICGLELEVAGPRILSIRGDADDPFSRGHICPKGVALMDIHHDPNRLRRPQKRNGGEWVEIGWDEAFDLAAERIAGIQKEHGSDAVGFYIGNPAVHNAGTLFSIPALARALRTKNAFSASSVDQLPHHLASLLMYGHQFLLPIPDIDRTHYLLMLGANPLASNGSLMTAPDVKRRLQAIRERGGRIVLVDPRRTETAAVADEHLFIRPATDAALLMALINTIRDEGLMRVPERVTGLDEALDAIREMTVERAEALTGITGIARIAREFASAPSAVCYGRVGTSLQAFGTLNQWLVQLLNLVTGNLDREGGALVTQPLVPVTGPGTRTGHYARWHSRVSARPESGGELPVAVLSEEILTPGEGQIRGFITIAGNPVLSTPDGRKLDEALASLDFMLAIDIYRNETTRRADLILPPASSLSHDHYDLIFNAFAIRNVARFNEAIWPREEDERYDWEIFHELSTRLGGKPVPSTAQALAMMLAHSGSSLDALKAAPHGIDLGPLAPSLFERLETPDGRIQCAPPPIVADVQRFLAWRTGNPACPPGTDRQDCLSSTFTLIGRRHLRSNNSWMHHSERLIKGKARDQLMMHPDDLASLHLEDGAMVEVRSRAGSVRAVVQSTTDVMRGVVSLPHGFAHVSYNDLTDAREVDAVSGNAALNGTRVEIVASERRPARP